MKNIIKYITVCLFSMSFFITAKAQDQNQAPDSIDPGDIVCIQVGENVFDCYLKGDLDESKPNDGKFHEYDPEQNKKDPYKEDDKHKEFERNNEYNQGDSIKGKIEEEREDVIQAVK